jgi:dTDP-4-dehydrorhamnose reductase
MTAIGRRITILGGRGMLGTDVADLSRQPCTTVRVLDLPEFDITNDDHLTDAVSTSDVIINCAAYTDVEKAESESQLVHKVNALAVGRLGEIAASTGVSVFHISTDFVFDGKSVTPYIETDKTNPISVYGSSKLAGEELLAQSGCRFCIMRVEWTYGEAGNNFVKKLINAAKTRDSLRVVDDQIGSPTSTKEVAAAIYELILANAEGIFHYAAGGYVSRYEMAKFIFDKLKIDVKIDSCKTSDYKTAAQRPLNSRFNCDKIQAVLSGEIRQWQEPLTEFLERL